MISEEGLQKYINLYQKKYGVCLDRETAFTMMSKLLRLVQIICPDEQKLAKIAQNTHRE